MHQSQSNWLTNQIIYHALCPSILWFLPIDWINVIIFFQIFFIYKCSLVMCNDKPSRTILDYQLNGLNNYRYAFYINKLFRIYWVVLSRVFGICQWTKLHFKLFIHNSERKDQPQKQMKKFNSECMDLNWGILDCKIILWLFLVLQFLFVFRYSHLSVVYLLSIAKIYQI